MKSSAKTSNKGKNKGWEITLIQVFSALGIAFFGFQHVLTTGEANRIFFPRDSHNLNDPPQVVPSLTSGSHNSSEPQFNHTVTINYFNLAMEGYFNESATNLQPLQVLKSYLQLHSQSTLAMDYKSCLADNNNCKGLDQRKFVVAWYSCPAHAGRRLHALMNALAWAVSTNRTLLVAYLTEESCLEHHQIIFMSCHNETDTSEEECNHHLRLQDWVPRYEEWKQPLNITELVRADGITKRDPWARPMDQAEAPRFIHVGMQANLVTGIDLTRPIQRSKLLSQEDNRERAKKLFYYGYYFAYGMMLEALVSLQGVVVSDKASLSSLSIALHSRHPRAEHEPAYTTLESVCIRKLLDVHNDSCVVYIMSDNVGRYGRLEQEIKEIGCKPKRLPHTSANDGSFYQDWILLRDSVRHGFLAPHRKLRQGIGMRPSSALLREAVEFRRVLEGMSYQMPRECFSRHDWDKRNLNCTPIERLASSFGLERFQQLHGIIKDPCVWKI